jgi:hypothetical protein
MPSPCSEPARLAREAEEDRPARELDLVLVPAGSAREANLREKHGTGNFTQYRIGTGEGKGVYSYDGSRFYVERNRKKKKSFFNCFS